MIIEIKPAADALPTDADCFVIPVTANGAMSDVFLSWLLTHYPSGLVAAQMLAETGISEPGQVLVVHNDGDQAACILAIIRPNLLAPPRLEWIEDAIDAAMDEATDHDADSIAIHALGCGSSGGLAWDDVRSLFERKFNLIAMDAILYEPPGFVRIN